MAKDFSTTYYEATQLINTNINVDEIISYRKNTESSKKQGWGVEAQKKK